MYRVLIADDEQLERRFLRHLVENAGLSLTIVGEAGHGKEAVELAELFQPNIILMDIKMPGMDGLTATRLIKEKKPAAEVVIISAYGEFSYSQQAIRYKVADYLLKPVQPDELAACLDRLTAHLVKETPGMEKLLDSAPSLYRQANDLVNAIKYADREAATRTGNQLVDALLDEVGPPSSQHITAFAFEFLILAGQGLLAQGEDKVTLSSRQNELARMINNLQSVTDLRQWVGRTVSTHIQWLREQRPGPNQAVIRRVKGLIHKDYAKQLTLTQVACHVHLSPAYLSRLFKNHTGRSFIDYLTEVRLKEAKALLLTGEISIERIADAVGFQNNSYFTAVFKKHEGLTPSEFRRYRNETFTGLDYRGGPIA